MYTSPYKLFIMTKLFPVNFVCTFEDDTCTFEELDEGSNFGADEFDWSWNKGGTPSEGTGPENDHTLGTSDGIRNIILLTYQNTVFMHYLED